MLLGRLRVVNLTDPPSEPRQAPGRPTAVR